MAGIDIAENHHNKTETPDQEDAFKQQEIDIKALTPGDRARLDRGEVDTKQLRAEIIQHKAAAEAELKKLTTIKPDTQEGTFLDLADYKHFNKRIQDAKSPEDAKKLIEEIREYPAQKKAEAKNDNEKRAMDDPELKEHFDKIIDRLSDKKVARWVGSNQVEPFKTWCRTELEKNPTIKNAKDILHRLNDDRNGLKPRQEFYERTIAPTLKKYGISLSEAPYIEKEGLSERKHAFEHVTDIEKTLEGMRNTGLYSFKAKQKIMRELLKAPDHAKIHKTEEQVNEVTRNESTQFTNQNSSIFKSTMVTVHGISVRAMSDASVKAFLDDYREYDLKTRATTVLNWKKIVENEGKLVKELGDVYKDDPQGFKAAVKSFALLPYTQKEQALKEHKRMVEKNSKEVLRESLDILHKSLAAIEEAKDKNILSNRTANRFKAYVQNTALYTNDKTGEVDLKKQQDLYDKLTDKTPVYDKKNRNISAYEAGCKKFKLTLAKFAKDNPDIDRQTLKDFQDDYNEGTFSERKQTYLKLKQEAAEKKKEREKNKKTEAKLNITETEKEEALKNSPERAKLIEAVKAYIEEKIPESIEKGLTAIYLYFAFSKAKISDDPEMKGLRDKLEELESALGTNTNIDEKSTEQEMLDEAEKVIAGSDRIDSELDELDYVQTGAELIEESERKHGNNTDSRKRSKKDALSHSVDEIEDDIIESFYEDGDKESILNEESTGDKVINVDFNEKRRMTTEEREELGHLMYAEQNRNFSAHGGTTKLEIEDNGRTLNKESREQALKQRKGNVIDMIADKLMARRQKTEAVKPASGFSDIAALAAARRAAEQKVKDRVESNVEKN